MALGIGEGSMVIVYCGNPREKMWGAVERLDGVGLVLRGLDLESVEDWIRQERAAVESYCDRFTAACGRDALEALIETSGRNA